MTGDRDSTTAGDRDSATAPPQTSQTRTEAVTALLGGVVGVAGSFLVAGASSSFVVSAAYSLVVDLLPAPVLTVSILTLGKASEVVGFAVAAVVTTLSLALVAGVGFWAGRRSGTPAALGVTYVGGWGVAVLLTGSPWTSLGVAVPLAVVVGLSRWRRRSSGRDVSESRRLVLRLAGTLGFGGVAYLLGNREPIGTPPRLSNIPPAEQAAIGQRLDDARSKSLDVRGIDGLVSPVTDFYEVDIDSVNPDVDADEWSLAVTGAVGEELTLSYDDLTSVPPTHRFVTLRCVGEPLNGDLMDTALWTGVPVEHLLDRASVRDEATHVVLHATDGYAEEFPLDAFDGGLLAYGMNGRLLPRNHGFPVRALVLGHWGEVNVKWLTEIELIAGERQGYWEKRDWHGTGPVNTVAKLHAVDRLGDGRIEVGGHAYAGTRGVQSVQVSTDGGDTWREARLSEPLGDADVWRQWAFTYRPPDGDHEVVVRAVDGTGEIQPATRAAAFPSGATGWVSKRIDG